MGSRALWLSRIGACGAAIALLLSLAHEWNYRPHFGCWDFYQFWRVGRALVEAPGVAIYDSAERERIGRRGWERAQEHPGSMEAQAAERRQVLRTFSTPWLYTLFGWFSTGDYERDLDLFQRASSIGFALAIVALSLRLGYSWTAALLSAAFFSSLFAPSASDASEGNVNRAQVAALVGFLFLQGGPSLLRQLLAGLLLGLLVAFKPNTVLAVAALAFGWSVMARPRKLAATLAGTALGVSLAVIASSLHCESFTIWLRWAEEAAELTASAEYASAPTNLSSIRFLEPVLGQSAGWLLLLFFGSMLLGSLLLFRSSKRARASEIGAARDFELALRLAGAGCAWFLLVSSLVWLHYLSFLALLALDLLRPRPTGPGGRLARTMTVVCLALLSTPVAVRTGGAPLPVATLVLFALAVVEPILLRAPPREPEQREPVASS